MGKSVAIIQSNYIPWKGYFDIINAVDEFILFDDMQYTRRDWRNRNIIKTPQGPLWLTIPVMVKGRYTQPIMETQVSDPAWAMTHWKTLAHNYGRAPYFEEYRERVEQMYRGIDTPYLSKINHRFIAGICEILGITTTLSWSSDYELADGKSERLLSLCRQAGATHYLAGPSSRGYLDEDLFREAGITVGWMDYSDYPEYPQLYPPFEHGVTILDLLFSVGPQARQYLKSFRGDR